MNFKGWDQDQHASLDALEAELRATAEQPPPELLAWLYAVDPRQMTAAVDTPMYKTDGDG